MCKFKAHKRCAVKAQSTCKWTTLAAIGKDIIEDEDGVSVINILCCQVTVIYCIIKNLEKNIMGKFIILSL